MQALPIDAFVPAAVEQLRARRNLVLVAEPGAGKTTRLPRALLDAGFAQHGEIVVLEPRRLATRMAAARVADELGEELGKRIGYQVRFEEKSSAHTRVRFVTEGVLTRKLIAEPALPGIAVVVLDELHERHLQGDVALALLRRIQKTTRPDLVLVAMSATLDAEPVAQFLECEVMRVPGRTFPVSVEHDEKPDDRPLEQRVAGAVRRLLREESTGDVLVFLPGAAEIRRAKDALQETAERANVELALLHGDLPAREQDRAVAPGPRRKVILSTNVAESSLTIEGVCAVVDSGLARVASHSPWSGLPVLSTAKISRASAAQRAGRAGRVRAGRCLRLYTQHDHDTRPMHDKPEIARAELCDTLLAVRAAGVELQSGDWLQAPPVEAWRAARELAERLGAIDEHGALTERGRRMVQMPLHPRLSRIVLEAQARGRVEEGCLLAALLSERDIAMSARARFGGGGVDVQRGPSDALDRMERFEHAEASGLSPSAARAQDLDPGAVSSVARVRDRLVSSLRGGSWRGGGRGRGHGGGGGGAGADSNAEFGDEPLLIALLSGFGDRVAKRRNAGSDQLVLGRGGSLQQSETSVVRDAELVAVLDASERGGRSGGAIAHLVSKVEPEWLLELWPERVRDRDERVFDAQRERVEQMRGLEYEGIVLDESRGLADADERTTRMLADAVKSKGLGSFFELDAIEHFERRVAHAARASEQCTPLPPDAREQALRIVCDGKRTFAELRAVSLLDGLRVVCAPETLAQLDRLAPDSIRLPSGRALRITYEADRPPWVQSRLQDFFGMRDAPKLGREPLVIHLLAPNQRPVQVTTDLAGFWQRHYPELRKQLMRRYPRHAWPEDPLTAAPPVPKPR